MTTKIGVEIVDVNGSFARFSRQAPRVVRAALKTAIGKIADRLSDEMYDRAPARSAFAPHLKDAIEVKQHGLLARVGILDGSAASGTEATMGEVALYNEYSPNEQPFLLPAAMAVTKPAEAQARKALDQIERELSIGGGG